MPERFTSQSLIGKLRYLFTKPGFVKIKHSAQNIQVYFSYRQFRQMRQLTHDLPLGPLLELQPRFAYKYLVRYTASSFSQASRLAALLNHYHFLAATMGPEFFGMLPSHPVIWRECCGDDVFTIWLSYPRYVGFEGELSLNLSINSTLLQVLAFVIVPGHLVGAASAHALLIGQVQGIHNAALVKHATKTLQDITPAMLLVNAAYGLATALGITQAVGISTEEQLCQDVGGNYFDYNSFWQQFGAEPTLHNLFLLAIPAPEKPLEHIKAHHRARTLRKRHYKQQVRTQVEQHVRATFLQEGRA